MFLHELAPHLGGITVEELESRISEAELQRWMIVDALSPIGARRDDLLTASIVLEIRSIFAKEPQTLGDAMLTWTEEEREERANERMRRIIQGRVARENG